MRKTVLAMLAVLALASCSSDFVPEPAGSAPDTMRITDYEACQLRCWQVEGISLSSIQAHTRLRLQNEAEVRNPRVCVKDINLGPNFQHATETVIVPCP
jgi:uncharacterized lipoprotein